MATRFGTVPVINYTGIPQAVATAISTPSVQQPMMVPLQIDWNVPWQAAGRPVAVGVAVNLSGTSPTGKQLDKIRCIKIDNTFSTVPIYVNFPDTGDVVTCPPQSAVTVPVNTNGQTFNIYAQGLTAGFIPYTLIYLFNVALPPTINPAIQQTFPQWAGSPSQQRTNLLSPGYGPPALGDQTFNATGNLLNDTLVNMWNTPRPSGVIIVCGLSVNAVMFQDISGQLRSYITLNGSVYGNLWTWALEVYCNNAQYVASQPAILFERSGMNLRLPATDTYYATSPTATSQRGGYWDIYSEYCYIP